MGFDFEATLLRDHGIIAAFCIILLMALLSMVFEFQKLHSMTATKSISETKLGAFKAVSFNGGDHLEVEHRALSCLH